MQHPTTSWHVHGDQCTITFWVHPPLDLVKFNSLYLGTYSSQDHDNFCVRHKNWYVFFRFFFEIVHMGDSCRIGTVRDAGTKKNCFFCFLR